MKKALLLVCALLLVLAGCKSVRSAAVTPLELAERLSVALRNEVTFTAADEDYIESNFEGLRGEGVVYFGDGDDAYEFGIFSLANTAKSTVELAIRAYIATETEALAAMETLYPSEELRERLTCYRNAYIGEGGGCVYYLIMDKEEVTTARAVLNTA